MALFGPSGDYLLVEVRVGVLDLLLVKIVDLVEVPEALSDVADAA